MDEKEKSKGISLRKKRKDKAPVGGPKIQISGPIPITQGRPSIERPPTASSNRSGGAGKSSLDVPRKGGPRPQPGGKTQDLVKRRYSTRFNAPVDFGDVPAMPSMPSMGPPRGLPTPPGTSSGRGGGAGLGQPIEVDVKALRDPNFQPERYVANLLADASEQEITAYQNSLQKMKNRASTDLQNNVFQNRQQFIKISKEIAKLKGEMRTMRGLLSELRTTSDSMKQGASGYGSGSNGTTLPSLESMDSVSSNGMLAPSKSRKQTNRSSIADLTAMYASQLQILWKNVEGSQKFLPALPGRHVVRDSPHWIELNAATWKTRRAMHMFLLNDHLLVASRKKKRVDQSTSGSQPKDGPVPSKLVAERCWPLQDIQMVDLSSSAASMASSKTAALSNAINIRVGKESFTYRTENTDEKLGLLLTFKKTADELRKTMRAENEEGQLKDSLTYLTARDPALSDQGELLKSLSATMGKDRPGILLEVDGKQQNLRWVESQMDELDELIALRRFPEAVGRIEKLRGLAKNLEKGNVLAAGLVRFKVDERAGRLAGKLDRDLRQDVNQMTTVKKNVSMLSRLGFEDRAREAFLEAKSGVVRKRGRQVIFDGALHSYIYQISLVQFTLIKNTVEIFQLCFEARYMSALVKWAKEHVEAFAELVNRQLSSVDTGSQVWRDCLAVTKENAQMLVDVGMDFKDIIGAIGEEQERGPSRAGGQGVGLGLK